MTSGPGSKVVAVVEARMSSARLPGKVLMPAGGRPLLAVLVSRLRRAAGIDEIVIATTRNPADDPIAELARREGVGVFRGSEDDVLGRVSECLERHGADVCVEVTGDCPLVDPAIVEEALAAYLAASPLRAYVSNSDPQRAVPAGLDVQVFSASALRRLAAQTTDPLDREHVTYGFYRREAGDRWNPLFIRHPVAEGATDLWVSLDYREDYELIAALHTELGATNPEYGTREIVEWVRAHPDLHARCWARRQPESQPLARS
jgi:spore coat polysaccharide biosynthesis protein SpsF